MIWQTIGAFVAVLGFSIILEVPRRYIGYAGAIGAYGWFIYLMMMKLGLSAPASNLVAAVFISIGAQIMARICKAPVTIFNIAGIMPLVPGAGMYRIVYYTLSGEGNLVTFYINQSLQIAGMISVGIFVVDAVFRQFYAREAERIRRKGNGRIH